MKKSLVRSIFAIVMVLVMMLSFAACDKEPASSDNGTNNNSGEQGNNVNVNQNSKWGLTINGKTIELPCTLADLESAGVNILIDSDKEDILNTANKKFTMIAATCEEDGDPIYLTIITGADTSQKEKNATVTILTNTTVGGSKFAIKNGIALGSDVNDIIEAYGEEYITSNDKNNLSDGYVVLKYGSLEDGAMFNFQDGKLTYIEFFVNQGE